MGWRILVNFIPIRHPMLKLKTHSGFHDLFLKYKYVRKETKLDCMIPLLFLLDTNIIYIVANGMVW